jgi:hypothetical protein
MDRTADLVAALEFVVGRIDEEAMRSGAPLTDEQRSLLNNLPTVSSLPEIVTYDPESPPQVVPRDTNYERLCAAAKAAYRSDRELNPASLDWQFAFDVSKLNRHPMNWLLQWAGVKQRRPWWDRWLLVCAALFVHNLHYSFYAPRDSRTRGSVSLGTFWCWIPRYHPPDVFCFAKDRRTAAGAKY